MESCNGSDPKLSGLNGLKIDLHDGVANEYSSGYGPIHTGSQAPVVPLSIFALGVPT